MIYFDILGIILGAAGLYLPCWSCKLLQGSWVSFGLNRYHITLFESGPGPLYVVIPLQSLDLPVSLNVKIQPSSEKKKKQKNKIMKFCRISRS